LAAAKSVHAYQSADLAALVHLHNGSYPANQVGPVFLAHHFNNVTINQGQVWTIRDANGPVGYATVTPVPGLTAVLDLQGCINPNQRRKGFGCYLLNHIIAVFKQDGRFQLSHAVPSLSTPAARFLKSQQFTVEHIERQMLLENPNPFPAVTFPAGFSLATYDQRTAVHHFRAAYEAIFQELPWYQPYMSDEDVTAELMNTADLLFLCYNKTIAGLAWLRMSGPMLGEIEPFGLLPAYQGQGLGYQFLQVAINQLITRRANRIHIGAWEENKRAIRLYQRVGFNHTNTQFFLAYAF
jgi:mycothiol synthase